MPPAPLAFTMFDVPSLGQKLIAQHRSAGLARARFRMTTGYAHSRTPDFLPRAPIENFEPKPAVAPSSCRIPIESFDYMSILRHHNNSGRTILNEQLTSQHQWLQRLVGNWACEYECEISPGEPVEKTSGTETFRSLGDIWVIGEGIMNTGDCAGRTVMTLGFDTRKQQFVGSFITSLMTHLWPYCGRLDSSGRKLILDSEGPSFSDEGAMARYQDFIEFIDDNHRVLSSQVLLSSGEWQRFMTAHYYRTPSTQAGQ